MFSVVQIGIGLLFWLQNITLITNSGFNLSVGATEIVKSFTVSGLIWVFAGVGLLIEKKWGWRIAITLYTICFIHQGWLFVRTFQMIDSTLTHSLDRLMYSRLSNAILFLIMVSLLLFTKRRFIFATKTNAQEGGSL
ncbi:hypothetical protein PAECIP111802_00488 [Paenibacillus allorhizosphaerae]|uniref:Uncharacterized protein n=1 Tax=Paenibacillus allorhizosphaerae TaxID=2849866 RepID=A0ABM8VB93_9BACL|nr:hypothetical protein PAECIP111802_00488 [Paenibacillus allorhizosphaerae]